MGRILVLRTEPGATKTAQVLRAMGHQACACPLLDIEPLAQTAESKRTLEQLHKFHGLIVISAHAGRLLTEQLATGRDSGAFAWPVNLVCYAVGPASAEPLRALGATVNLPSNNDFCTEGLLALAGLQNVMGHHIVLARGEGGLETLAAALTDRGAQVDHLVLYRRAVNTANQGRLQQLLASPWDVVLIGSGEILQALADAPRPQPLSCPLLVPSERIETQAKTLGFTSVNAIKDLSAETVQGWLQASDC